MHIITERRGSLYKHHSLESEALVAQSTPCEVPQSLGCHGHKTGNSIIQTETQEFYVMNDIANSHNFKVLYQHSTGNL